MGQRSLRDAVLTISDGGSESVEVRIGEGNITWSEKQSVEYTRNRGEIDGARLGDDEACEVKFDIVWDWLSTNTSGVTPVEIIKGIFDGAESTAADCTPYACDLEIEIFGCTPDTADETITFSNFRWESLDYDLRAGQISCNGRIMDREPVIT